MTEANPPEESIEENLHNSASDNNVLNIILRGHAIGSEQAKVYQIKNCHATEKIPG